MVNYIPLLIILVISYIPSFAWLGFVLSQDVHPEKATDIAKTFILGNFIAVPVVLFSVWGREILDLMLIQIPGIMSSFIFGALMEEVWKGAFVYWFAISTSKWDEPIDTFIYAATLALGFAGIENFAYAVSDMKSGFNFIQQLLFLRSFTSVIIHLISSFLVTYGLAFYCKYNKKINGIWLILAGIVFHGLWNLVITISGMTNNLFILAFYFIICIPLFIVIMFFTKHLKIKSKNN